MAMTNAEWMIKQGMKFSRLTWEYTFGKNRVCYETGEHFEEPKELYSEKSATMKNIILKWLDMEHEETEDKHNDVKHAHWIDMRLDDVHVCSHCDKVVVFSNGNDLIYCPYCGARMDGKDNDN